MTQSKLLSELDKKTSRATKKKTVEAIEHMASHFATQLNAGNLVSDDDWMHQHKTLILDLTSMMHNDPSSFGGYVNRYVDDLRKKKVVHPNIIDKKTLQELGVLTESGKIRSDASTRMTSRVVGGGKSLSLKELGVSVEVDKNKLKKAYTPSAFGRTKIGQALRGVSSSFENVRNRDLEMFNPNVDKQSSTFGSAQSFSKTAFKKDEDYRNSMLIILKQINNNGLNATKEEKLLAAEIKKLNLLELELEQLHNSKKLDEYITKPQDRMTDGGKAVYSIVSGLGKGLSSSFGGLKGLLSKDKDIVPEDKDLINPEVAIPPSVDVNAKASDIKPVASSTIVGDKKRMAANQEMAAAAKQGHPLFANAGKKNVSAANEDAHSDENAKASDIKPVASSTIKQGHPLFANAGKKNVSAANEDAHSDENVEISYVMKHDSDSPSMLDTAHRKAAITPEVFRQNPNRNKGEDAAGKESKFEELSTIEKDASDYHKASIDMFKKIDDDILAGNDIQKDNVGSSSGISLPASGGMGLLAKGGLVVAAGAAGYAAGTALYNDEGPLGQMTRKKSASLMDTIFGDPQKDLDAQEAKRKADVAEIIKSRQNRADNIDKKQDEAVVAKDEKSKTSLASTIINNTSKSTPTTMITGNTNARGKDNTRNSDSTLALFLNNRVTKFA